MKRVMILCICILLSTACTALKNNAGNDNQNTATDSAITGSSITTSAVSGSTVSAVAVSETAVEEKKERVKKEVSPKSYKTKKPKVTIVIDETGKKRKLKMCEINAENNGMRFLPSWPTGLYSQVSDGHYYYLKSDGKLNYTIYRDKGKEVGRFCIDIEAGAFMRELDYFVKYGTEYYGILYCLYEQENQDEGIEKCCLIHVDLKKEKAELIFDLTNRTYGDALYLYQKGLYFEDQSTIDDEIDWSEFEWYDFPGDFVKMDMKRNFSETILSSTNHLDRQLRCLTFMDGKIYYGVQKGKKVTLYSYDLKNKKEEKILFYERKKAYHKYTKEVRNTWIEMDEDYIYCQDYIIPRAGGEMIPLFRQAKLFNYTGDDPSLMPYAYNTRYIFYIDKKNRVHRYGKKTKADIIISDIKAMDVKCTENYVYVQEYDKYLTGEGNFDVPYMQDDPSFSNIYCMDMDGKHVEKIAEKVVIKKDED